MSFTLRITARAARRPLFLAHIAHPTLMTPDVDKAERFDTIADAVNVARIVYLDERCHVCTSGGQVIEEVEK